MTFSLRTVAINTKKELHNKRDPVDIAKGQTKSEWFFEADDSSKKRTNKFVFWPDSTMNKFFPSFFGGN